MSRIFFTPTGKVHAHGRTVKKVIKLKIMSKEKAKRLKIMIKDLKNNKGAYNRPHYENHNV
jgi:GH24 family phage-related lysozyme (muramidase)